MSIPVIIAIILGECKRKAFSFIALILISCYFFLGVYSNLPEKDEFSSLMNFIDSNYEENDLVVVDTMPHFLSYKFYDKKNSSVSLYTPPKINGDSTKPNDFGFGAIFKDNEVNNYLENFDAINIKYRRLWILSDGGEELVYKKIPDKWGKIGMLTIGSYSLHLFCIKPPKGK